MLFRSIQNGPGEPPSADMVIRILIAIQPEVIPFTVCLFNRVLQFVPLLQKTYWTVSVSSQMSAHENAALLINSPLVLPALVGCVIQQAP